MAGLGLLIGFWGYAILYWGIEGIQGITQPRFLSYVFPWISSNPSKTSPPKLPPGKKPTGGGGGGSGGGGGGFGG